MATVNDVLTLAKKYIGTKENPANSNNVVFNADYYGRAVNGAQYAWCCVLQWDLMRMAGASKLFYDGNKTASCTTLMTWAKANGLFVTGGYEPGDMVFMNFDSNKKDAEHIGIVESVSGSTVHTIEGNTSIGNDSNGGEVMRRERSVGLILGAFRPKYDTESTATTTTSTGGMIKVTFDTSTVRSGTKGKPVMLIQSLLNGLGYNCGSVDGDAGSKTTAGIKAYQKAKGLSIDGIAGANTWSSLMAQFN